MEGFSFEEEIVDQGRCRKARPLTVIPSLRKDENVNCTNKQE